LIKPLNLIINAIKNKDKDLEGLFVITDELSKIVTFSKNEEELQHFVGKYNFAKDFQGLRKYELLDLKIRKKLKKLL